MSSKNEVLPLDASGTYSVDDTSSVAAAGKASDCYLGLLFSLEDAAVYGYITPLKVKIVLALPVSDSVIRDAEIITVSDILSRVLASMNTFLSMHRYLGLFIWPIIPLSQIHFSS